MEALDEGIDIFGQLWKISQDHEGESKVTFLFSSSELGKVILIPAQTLLRINVRPE